ncbi:YchJ family protein [Thalassotalea sp. PP2-459]|uniref:YchJ family protein n=1 Tax=Thalassotalea sp. PP2-459 TaxID=1742724 RepID=UPI0009F82111|nr:YchJ family metal-binding protein [Thalassotalea sp. PP2-459]
MMLCLCGSKQNENACCKRIVEGSRVANFPEQLMRSRYYSYAVKNVNYLCNTYTSPQKVASLKADISAWCQQTQWLKLVIHDAENISREEFMQRASNAQSSLLPTVTFSAFFIVDNVYCQMSEKSRFTVEDNQWRYESGDVIEQIEIAKLTRNSPCPCESGKKYKRCCMR